MKVYLDIITNHTADVIKYRECFKNDCVYRSIADYRDVDPIVGTLADFDALLARALALGLKVIIDQV